MGFLDSYTKFVDGLFGAKPNEPIRLRDYDYWSADFIQRDADKHAKNAAAAAGKMQQAIDRGDHDAAMRHLAKVGEESAKSAYAATEAAMARDEQGRQETERYPRDFETGHQKERAPHAAVSSFARGTDVKPPDPMYLDMAMNGSMAAQALYVRYAERLDLKNRNAGMKLEPGAPTIKQQMVAKLAEWNAAGPQKLPKLDHTNAPRLPKLNPGEKPYSREEITANQEALSKFTAQARKEQLNALFPFLADSAKPKTAVVRHKLADTQASQSNQQKMEPVQKPLPGQRQGISPSQHAQLKQGAGGALYERGVQDVQEAKRRADSMSPQELANSKEKYKAAAVDLTLLLASMDQAPLVAQQQKKKQAGDQGMSL